MFLIFSNDSGGICLKWVNWSVLWAYETFSLYHIYPLLSKGSDNNWWVKNQVWDEYLSKNAASLPVERPTNAVAVRYNTTLSHTPRNGHLRNTFTIFCEVEHSGPTRSDLDVVGRNEHLPSERCRHWWWWWFCKAPTRSKAWNWSTEGSAESHHLWEWEGEDVGYRHFENSLRCILNWNESRFWVGSFEQRWSYFMTWSHLLINLR